MEAQAAEQPRRAGAPREVEHSRSFLAAALDATAEGLLVVDLEGRITLFNAKLVEMWSLPRAVVDARDDQLAIAYVLDQLAAPQGFVARTEAVYATPEAESLDRLELNDGRVYERSSKPQRVEGKVVGRVWSFRDVTARVRVERERERLHADMALDRELLKTVVDYVPVGIAVRSGPELVYELVNPGFIAIFGEKPRVGKPFALAASEEAPFDERRILEHVLTTGEPYRAVGKKVRVRRTPDSPLEDRCFSITYLRVPTSRGAAVLAVVVETTEQENARREIERLAGTAQRQAAELEGIHESMIDGIIACDASGRITHLNEAQMTLIGREGIRGKSCEEYAALIGIRHLDGSLMRPSELPLARAIRGETVRNEGFCLGGPEHGRQVIVRANASPIRDHTGRIIGAVAVNRDVSEFVELDRLKDQFLRVAAHELKTPVAIMKGYADVLLRAKDQLPAAARGPIEAIERGALKIDRIVTELLDVSLLLAGKMEMRLERVELAEVVDTVTRRFALSAPRHRLRVVVTEPVVIRADRTRLEQLLGKLLDNAIRYSPRGGDVDVSLEIHGGEAVVRVRDRGIGIPADKQRRVFERFYRPHTDTPHDYGGMGVGLYIAREIVARHGGTMSFESREGEGSVFCFRLPIRPG
ncbi:MAG: hypothetical protein BGO98_02375 [Myxococcales bacterium 68-20]|nr:PAS domain-containing protein [Myxococcales bacterium]OJY21694.1 MAG: hypothetical protein BGO98_02375 [Myxococcales bacterium 68-20]